MPSNVRGIVRTMHIIAETPAQRTEHDAPAVTRHNVSGRTAHNIFRHTGIKGDQARQDVRAAYKHNEDDLCGAQDFAPDGPPNNISYIGHVVYMWVSYLEHAQDVARGGRNEAKSL